MGENAPAYVPDCGVATSAATEQYACRLQSPVDAESVIHTKDDDGAQHSERFPTGHDHGMIVA